MDAGHARVDISVCIYIYIYIYICEETNNWEPFWFKGYSASHLLIKDCDSDYLSPSPALATPNTDEDAGLARKTEESLRVGGRDTRTRISTSEDFSWRRLEQKQNYDERLHKKKTATAAASSTPADVHNDVMEEPIEINFKIQKNNQHRSLTGEERQESIGQRVSRQGYKGLEG